MNVRGTLIGMLIAIFLFVLPAPLFSKEGEAANNDDIIRAITRNTVSVTAFDIGDNIKILRGKGTGVLISCDVSDPTRPKSLILTNWHVGVGRTQIDIAFSDGVYNTAAEVNYWDEKSDYALLLVPYAPKNCEHVHYRTSHVLDRIIVGGFRWIRKNNQDESIFFFLDGSVSTVPTRDGFVGISAPVSIGSSGSGVWMADGKSVYLVGIVSSVGGRDVFGNLCDQLQRSFGRSVCGRQFFEPILSPGSGMMVPVSLIYQDAVNRIGIVRNCARCEDIKKLLNILDTLDTHNH